MKPVQSVTATHTWAAPAVSRAVGPACAPGGRQVGLHRACQPGTLRPMHTAFDLDAAAWGTEAVGQSVKRQAAAPTRHSQQKLLLWNQGPGAQSSTGGRGRPPGHMGPSLQTLGFSQSEGMRCPGVSWVDTRKLLATPRAQACPRHGALSDLECQRGRRPEAGSVEARGFAH